MSNFRELQEKLQKIEESYYSDLDLSIQELRRANPKMSAVNLVRLARAELGGEAAKYLSDQLETEGDASDYFAGTDRQNEFPHPIQDEVVQEGPLDNEHPSQEKDQNWQDALRAKLASAETKDYPWSRKDFGPAAQGKSGIVQAQVDSDQAFDDWLEQWPGESIEEDDKDTFHSRLRGENFAKGDRVFYRPESSVAMGERGKGYGTVIGTLTNDSGEPNVVVEWDNEEYAAMGRFIHPAHLIKADENEDEGFWNNMADDNPFEGIEEDSNPNDPILLGQTHP